MGRGLRLSNRDLNRYHRQVIGTASCDIWAGAIGSDEYGRFSITNPEDGARMLTPHQVGARLGFGPLPVDCTLMHDCEVRLCCSSAPGHVRIATQKENMRQAVARGRSRGPRPGLVDTRGVVGASRAIQAAILSAVQTDPGIGKAALAAVLAAAVAAGDPLRHLVPLFDAPPPVTWSSWTRASTPPPRSAGCSSKSSARSPSSLPSCRREPGMGWPRPGPAAGSAAQTQTPTPASRTGPADV